MGVALIKEVLECAPVDLAPSDRLVLLNLAEKANDATRQVLPSRADVGLCLECASLPGLCSDRRDEDRGRRRIQLGGSCCASCLHEGESPKQTLLRRTGLKEDALKKVLQRLSRAGLEVRVAISADKHGQPVYGVPGRAANFCVPALKGGTSSTLQEEGTCSTHAPKGGTSSPSGGNVLPPSEAARGEHVPTPVPQSVKGSVIDARETDAAGAATAHDLNLVPPDQRAAVVELLARLGDEITEADAVDCVAWAATKAKTNLGGYLSRFTATEVHTRAEEHRTPGGSALPPKRCPLPGHRGLRGNDADGDPYCGECADARGIGVAS